MFFCFQFDFLLCWILYLGVSAFLEGLGFVTILGILLVYVSILLELSNDSCDYVWLNVESGIF